jgi:diguanylate cyclase (GGDEF)-like protein
VADEDPEDALEVAAVEDQQPVQPLGARGASEALRDRVRRWCSHRRPDDADAFAAEDLVEGAAVPAIAVANEEAKAALAEAETEMAPLLGHPLAARIGAVGCGGSLFTSRATPGPGATGLERSSGHARDPPEGGCGWVVLVEDGSATIVRVRPAGRRVLRLMATSAFERESFEGGYRRLAGLVCDVVAEQAVGSVLARVLATLRELVRCEDVVVWETAGDGELAVVLVEGEDEEQMRGMRIRLGDGLTGLAALHRRVEVSNDAHVDARAGLVPGTERVPEAVACMPLIAREQLLGVLSLYRRGPWRRFSGEEIQLVADFAAVAALALDNARTRADLELLAQTDDLTGLSNRRHFRRELEREIAAAHHDRSPLSLLLLDLDNFKAINDSHGHTRGDAALQSVADSIRQRLRPGDLAARVGGDEFVVMLPRTGRAAAEAVAAAVATSISDALAPLAATASIGVSTLREKRDYDLLADADRLLYQAKRAHPAPESIRLNTPTDEHASRNISTVARKR